MAIAALERAVRLNRQLHQAAHGVSGRSPTPAPILAHHMQQRYTHTCDSRPASECTITRSQKAGFRVFAVSSSPLLTVYTRDRSVSASAHASGGSGCSCFRRRYDGGNAIVGSLFVGWA